MTRGEPIVISDSDSDTLSESERPRVQETSQTKSKAASTSRPPAPQLAKEPPAAEEPTASTSHEALSESGPYTNAATSATGLLSLLPDRRQLELERKERARKRKQQQNLPSTSSDEEEAETSAKRTKQNETHADSRAKPAFWSEEARATNEAQPTPQPMGIRTAPATPSSSDSKFSRATDPIEPQSRFWRGTIKHGFNAYADQAASGVTISQMLLPATASSRNGLQLAVLATYDLRMDWLYSLFPKGLPVTLILPPPKEDYRTDPSVARPGLHRSEIFGDFARCPGWQICVPSKPKGGWLTQHMKFLILVHPDFLRVAILSGNLNGIDWERIENTAYIQDFPLNTDTAKAATPAHGSSQSRTNDFKAQLVRILRSLGMPSSHPVYAALDRHDFSQATRARIVASWPEASNLAEWDRMETQGLGRLGKVVRDLGIQPKRSGSLQLECQGSSLANHDIKWIEHFHLLASGFNPRGLLPFKGKTNDPHPEYFKAAGSKSGSLPPIKICFPSQRYVEETTVEGPLGAMSFFGKAETFAASPIKKLYFSPQSRRGDVMIHAKSILALTTEGAELVNKAFHDASEAQLTRGTNALVELPENTSWSPNEEERPIGWTYMGSSNFTRAAHGNISGTAAKPTMSTLNWELGVVLPIYASEVERFGVEAESLRPIVYHRPLQQYSSSDTPWNNATAQAQL